MVNFFFFKGYTLILSHFTVNSPCTFSNSSGGNESSSIVTDCAVLGFYSANNVHPIPEHSNYSPPCPNVVQCILNSQILSLYNVFIQ